MSELPIQYLPAPGDVWLVNTSNNTPTFLSSGSKFDIVKDTNGAFKLVLLSLPAQPEKSLVYDNSNLFMNAPPFLTSPGDIRQYRINFKLAPADSVGRGQKTLYCTIQTEVLDPEGMVQSSEQGVFGAEEDGGGASDD